MKNFMDENFLLQTETAQKLYHEHGGKNADYRLSLPLDSGKWLQMIISSNR